MRAVGPSAQTQKCGLSRSRVVELLGPSRGAALYSIEHQELDFGAHWWWSGTQPVFTSSGLDVLAGGFAEIGDAEASGMLRNEAAQLAKTEALLFAGEQAAPLASTRKPRALWWQEVES